MVALGADARPRLARPRAGDPVAGGVEPAVPRLGGRVPVRGPRFGLADGQDRGRLVPGRHGGAGERHRGEGRDAVVL
jgi:hypothetical protein